MTPVDPRLRRGVELQVAGTRYQRDRRRAEEAREARNVAIRVAIADGYTHAWVAKLTGLTRARVGQIAKGRDDSV